MSAIPALISDLTVILVLAGLTTLLCKKLNLPSVLGYILAGVLVGPVVEFIPTITDTVDIELWSDIGVIFLMFSLGLEFSLHKMGEVGGTGLFTAGVQAVGMGAVGFLLGAVLGWSSMDSVFLGVMLAMSSTMITMKNIEDMGLKKEKFASFAMGTLVIEDLIAIFAMVILSTIAVSHAISGWELVGRIAVLLFYLALWLILGTYLIPTLMKKLVGLMNDEVLLVFSLGLCFFMAVLAERIGFSRELGAFLAGSLLAGTVHAERVEQLVTPCKNLFGAVFFVSVGFMVQPTTIWQYLPSILLISAVAIAGKLVFLTLGMLAAGQELTVSVYAAAAQTQVGEFSFILAGLGRSLGVTGVFLYPVIVAVSVLTTFTTPFMLRLAGPLSAWLEEKLPERRKRDLARYQKEKTAIRGNRDWQMFLRHYCRSFFLYGVLSCGVIAIGERMLLPGLTNLLADHAIPAKAVCSGAIYGMLAMLLPAMLRMKKRYFTALWLDSFANRLLLCVLVILRLLAAIALLVAPAVQLFHIPPLWLALAALPVIWLITRSNKLAGRYLEVEARFLANFNERKLAARFGREGNELVHHWLTEQMSVLVLACPGFYPEDGVSLEKHDWGRVDHIKVIKIIRGKESLHIPEGFVKIYSQDILVVMGDTKALDNFRIKQERMGVHPGPGSRVRTLKEYIESQQGVPKARQLLCCGVTLEKDAPQTGKSIRDSGIKNDWCCFLIGLERDLLPIPNPDPNLYLKAGDLLWVVGPQEMASRLMRAGLLD